MKKIFIILTLVLFSGCNRFSDQNLTTRGAEILNKKEPWTQVHPKVLELSIKDRSVEDSYFDHTAFIGDSRLIDIHKFGAIKTGYILAESSLGVNKLDSKLITTTLSEEKLTVYEALKLQLFDRIYLSFGINELGYDYPEIFIEQFVQVLKIVREIQPQADLVLLIIFPISAEKDAAEKVMNNSRIKEYNQRLEVMARDLEIYYFKDYSSLLDEDNCLSPSLTDDGIHLNDAGYQLWADALRKATIEVNNE